MGLDNGVRETTEERQKHKEDCEALALREASKSASAALVASGAGVFAANTFLPAFRRAIGTSGKAALVATPAFFTFFYVSQTTMNNCARGMIWTDDVKTGEFKHKERPNVSPVFFMFFLKSEQVMNQCTRSKVFRPDADNWQQ